MTRKQFRWALALTAAAAVGLPSLGKWYRRQRQQRCALDGAPIEPIYAVKILGADGGDLRFCCIRCAEYWLERQSDTGYQVRVTDEVTGHSIGADDASFVRSTIVTNHATGNRIHAFRRRTDAEEHAAANRGRLLVGEDRPFQPAAKAAESARDLHQGKYRSPEKDGETR